MPNYPVQSKTEGDQDWIFDRFRRKYVALTPEEWVRQHFLNYLVNELGYPKSLVKVERGLTVNKMDKRTDIIVYDREARPFLLVECKSAQVHLTDKAFNQLSVYNKVIKARYLVITNGLKHYCCCMDYSSNSYRFQSQLPVFGEHKCQVKPEPTGDPE